MAQRCAVVTNGVVTNIILANPDFVPGGGQILAPSATAQIGYTYDGTNFTVVVPPVIPQTEGLTYQMLTKLFTAAELTAILTVAISKPIIITWMLKMASFGPMISLTDPQVTTALNYLVAQGLITPARQTAILAGTIVNANA